MCVSVYVSVCVCCLTQVERAYSICGTIEYMAPEIVEGGESGHDKVSLNTAVLPTNIICLTEKNEFGLPFKNVQFDIISCPGCRLGH